MATLLRLRGYRFYFHSQATGEPPHLHVDKERKSAKFWIESTTVVRNVGFSVLELREIARIIIEYRLDFLRIWNEHFDQA
nr:DUF4160 domain-containing protein [uncultured Duganella sp.]